MAETIQINETTWRFEDGQVRFYLFCGTQRAALIDSGMTAPDARELAAGLTDKPLLLINTHADPDHISGNAAFDAAYMSPAEEGSYRAHGGQGRVLPLREGDVIDLGERPLRVIDIPGHTPGSIALLDERHRVLVSGDSVQDGNIFMFGPGRDMGQYIGSLEHLSDFAGQFDEIYPMHGSFPVLPGLIPELIAAAREIAAGRAKGEIVSIFGREVRLCRFPCAGFLCPIQD